MARKMALVPQQMLEALNQQRILHPQETHVSTLDDELRLILDNKNLPPDIKCKLYSQAMNKFLNFKNEVIEGPPPPPPPKQSAPEPPQKSEADSFLIGLPKTYKDRGRGLLAHIKNNPYLSWNENKELVYDGQSIPNSNIVDLIQDYSRPRARVGHPSPPGLREFEEALKRNNTPKEFMRSQRRATPQRVGLRPRRWNHY